MTDATFPDDFDAVDFELWRLECALDDAERLSLDDVTRAAIAVARARIHEERARRVA